MQIQQKRRSGQLLIGRLKEHGPANYRFRAKEDASYYVKLLTSRGERILWGKDIERARLARRLRDEQADIRESMRAAPGLKSTFLSVRPAEDFAAKPIADPEDRKRFLELVKGAPSMKPWYWPAH